MAIQFARIELVGRSGGGNACCKGAYNARTIIKDQQTNITYNFAKRGDNVHHEVLLPEGVDQKFKNVKVLMNEIERIEKRKNSSLLKDIVIALPDDKELDLQDRINISRIIIDKMEWVKEGLGVQLDVHQPHNGEKNWHAHILLTKRRFAECGTKLGTKARDLDIQIRGGNNPFGIPEEQMIHEKVKDVINDYFKSLGLENRVDSIGINPQEHIAPIRMRSVLNQAADRNEERRIAEIEHLNNSAAVLDKVTSHISVFSRGDLMRAVKCVPNIETREKLVEDALGNKGVIALFKEDGTKTGYFTTAKIRLEESKILRLSGYLANGDNIFMKDIKDRNIQRLVESARGSLTEEQHIALSELITSSRGLRILRGRAGVGKSHVLGQVALIARASNINVIGLAPTHKAREALIAGGYSHTDTIKGMLFKLHNARFSLPKHSLLVVDEAGLIGNDDYQELLRVAATRKCNVILSGDERQLSSVGRGGMFEVFASTYGSSSILDIKRQENDWGKSVAIAFSVGNVRSGISILTEENRINRQASHISSMEALLADWHKSSELPCDRLILAVKNKDVATLNHGVRQYLKADGKLTGLEIEVGGNHYMKGDRILIQKTNKEFGIVNGDLAEILEVTKDRFVISMQNIDNFQNTHNTSNGDDADDSNNTGNTKIIEFNPSEYQGFRHGYATTVFKSQGASIKDVYVFHDGFAGLRNSYVALSRHINELKLYVNSNSTPNQEALIKQLSYDPENGSSLHFYSEEDSKTLQQNSETLANLSLFDSILLKTYDFAASSITKLTDKYLPQSEYYNYQEPEQKAVTVAEVIDRVYEQSQNIVFENEICEQKLVVGSNINIPNKTRALPIDAKLDNILTKAVNTSTTPPSTKSKFYANVDYARGKLQRQEQQRASWNSESEELRREIRICAEQIARDLLGEPNKHLSNGRELKFGDTGKIAVRISGEKAGTWYDFSEGKGGDLFSLVEHKRSGDFKCAAEYLRRSIGMVSSINNSQLQLVHDHANSNITEKYIKEQKAKEREAEAKQVKVNKLYDSSKAIDDNSVAHRYLTKVRSVTCALGNDIKTTSIYEKETNRHLPAVIAFARDEGGNITGGLRILLDSKTANKASIDVPKKSFGRIAGSFVDVGSTQNRLSGRQQLGNHNITIIAEGLETALSAKQALTNDLGNEDKTFKILCSLGISNIKNYRPQAFEKIIIAADNDGHDSITNKTIENAKLELTNKGAFVEIVRPSKDGDLNDILQDKTLGEKEIQSSFNRALAKHCAVTLKDYFNNKNDGTYQLSKQEKEDIDYISQFKTNEEKIVNAYRISSLKGNAELEATRKSIAFADSFVYEHKYLINEANHFGAKIDNRELVVSLLGRSYAEMETHLTAVRDKYYIIDRLDELAKDKQQANTPQDALKALKREQEFLSSLHNNLNPSSDHDKQLLDHIQKAHEFKQSNEIGKLYDSAHYAYKEKIISADDLTDRFKSGHYLDVIHNDINSICHKHNCDIINDHYKKLSVGQPVIHQGHKFDCIVEYLEHWKDNVNHNMLPIKDIDHVIERELDRQREIDHRHHGLDL